jgi:hypothetical protein
MMTIRIIMEKNRRNPDKGGKKRGRLLLRRLKARNGPHRDRKGKIVLSSRLAGPQRSQITLISWGEKPKKSSFSNISNSRDFIEQTQSTNSRDLPLLQTAPMQVKFNVSNNRGQSSNSSPPRDQLPRKEQEMKISYAPSWL